MAESNIVRKIIRRHEQHVRYLATASICAIASNIVLIAGAAAGLNYLELSLLSFGTVGTLGYGMHSRFTFGHSPSWPGYARFMSGLAAGIPFSFAILSLLGGLLRLPMWIAAPIATVIMLLYNFVSAKAAIGRRLFR